LAAFVRSPVAQTRVLNPSGAGQRLAVNLAIAAGWFAASIAWLAVEPLTSRYPANSTGSMLLVAALSVGVALGVWVVTFVLLWIATTLEGLGLTALARVHGWRLPRRGRRALVAHGSHGWVLPSPLALLAPVSLQATGFRDAPLLVLVGVVLVGLVWFEAVVYFGTRANGFANWPPEPGAVEPVSDGPRALGGPGNPASLS
jgi:hypothetical protein